jgi:hypothetical protein
MTGAELRALQRKARHDAKRAQASARALREGILRASGEGWTERAMAAELGIGPTAVHKLKTKAQSSADASSCAIARQMSASSSTPKKKPSATSA